MSVQQGSLELLQSPAAQQMLQSIIPARLAYSWTDGTPRVVPIWFHWDGHDIVLGTPPDAPKVAALQTNPKVALTIDEEITFRNVLMIRGTAKVTMVDGVVPEYASAAERYLGPEQGKGWATQAAGLWTQMARIAIRPEWVGVIDWKERWPNAVARAVAKAQAGQG